MTADPAVRRVIMHAARGNAMTAHAGVSWAMGRMQQRSDLPRYGGCPDLGSPAHGRSVDMLCHVETQTHFNRVRTRSREGGWGKQSKRSADCGRACPACLPFVFAAVQLQKTNKTAIASENCQSISASLLTLTNHVRAQRLTPKKRPLETNCPKAGRARKPLLLAAAAANHTPTLPRTRVCLST